MLCVWHCEAIAIEIVSDLYSVHPSRPSAPAAVRATVASQRQRHPREGLHPVPAQPSELLGVSKTRGPHRPCHILCVGLAGCEMCFSLVSPVRSVAKNKLVVQTSCHPNVPSGHHREPHPCTVETAGQGTSPNPAALCMGYEVAHASPTTVEKSSSTMA